MAQKARADGLLQGIYVLYECGIPFTAGDHDNRRKACRHL
jgi:hypothetical protein